MSTNWLFDIHELQIKKEKHAVISVVSNETDITDVLKKEIGVATLKETVALISKS